MQQLRHRVAQFWSDRRGVSAVFLTIALSSVVGMVALGTEAGMWFSERRGYQTAADAGALAGAYEMANQMTGNGGTSATLTTGSTGMAWKEAVNNGAPNSSSNITVSQLSSPTAAKVVVSVPQSSILSGGFLSGVTVKTTAVAKVLKLDPACVLGLNTTGTDVTMSGNPTVNLNDCVLATNSTDSASVDIFGSASLSVEQIHTAGGVSTHGNPSVPPGKYTWTGAGTTPLPFNTPSAISPFGASPGTNCSTPLSPGQYSPGMSLSGTCTLSPGTYFVENGDFSIGGNTSVTGSGVTIVLTGTPSSKTGSISIKGTASLTLTAPVTLSAATPYPGFAVYQDPNAPSKGTNSFGGNGKASISGAIYTPAQGVNYGGNSATGGTTSCLVIVAATVTFSGNPTLDTTGCASDGLTLKNIYTVALIQ